MASNLVFLLSFLVAVIFLLFLAKHALNRTKSAKLAYINMTPRLNLIGDSPAKLWGLPIREWQERAFTKAGVTQNANAQSTVHIGIEWVLSAALAKAFVAGGRIALIADNKIIGVNDVDAALAQSLIGQAIEALVGTDIKPVHPYDLDDGYNKALRKTEPPYALNIHETPIAQIQKRQYNSSYKGITDFVTKWFWPLPAFYATRLCAALRLTPNMVTTVSLILTFLAIYYFAKGDWVMGFVTGWLMTFLDTVDGKLARTTMTYSKWGNLYDHGIDAIHPPFWYIAWFVGLGSNLIWPQFWTDPMSLAMVAIIIGYLLDRLFEGIFMRKYGFHIHVWKKFNSMLRFFIARRNPNMFIFMIGIALTAWYPNSGKIAFITIAVWVWICLSINFITLIIASSAKKPLKSWMAV